MLASQGQVLVLGKGANAVKVKRVGPTTVLRGYGLVAQGAVYDLPAVPEGEGWQALDARVRVTEPAPREPTVAELRERLREAGVSVPAGAVKADLLKLVEEATE